MRIDVVTLGAATLDPDSGAPLVQALQPLSGDDDAEPFGDVALMQCLGVTSFPYPGDASGGYCEGVVVAGAGGANAVVVGARDTRTASIVGNGKPGDTIVHSTGPQQSAQLQLKEDKRQAVLVSKGTDGTQILISIDGKNDKVTIAAFGGVFEMTPDGSSLMHPNGQSGLIVGADGVQIVGKLLGGIPVPGVSIAMGPAAALAAAGLVPCLSIAGQ